MKAGQKIKFQSSAIILVIIYLYLALPALIFMIGWLRWYWALLFGILTAIACGRSFTEAVQKSCVVLKYQWKISVVVTAVILICLWVFLSGIGGYCYQNSDHNVRNTIFHVLVTHDWPVIGNDGSRGLVYYIGFWLPAACIGKVFGIEAGYAAQYVWAVLGICIVYYLICVYRQKVDLLPVMFLIFFSGLDYVGTWILSEEGVDLRLALHLERWLHGFQYSSTTTQLFWVFNQAIPAWIATIFVLLQKNSKNILFILSLIMLTSTFPFVGLIPIVLYLSGKRVVEKKARWNEIVTFQNIAGVCIVGGICFLYLSGNVSGENIARNNAGAASMGQAVELLKYLLFYSLEFGIYLLFLWRQYKNDSMLWVITVILICCPFIRVGDSIDFCMRASIPALFILMLYCMDALEKLRKKDKKWVFAAYCMVLLLGAITPFNEIHRTINETFGRIRRGESVRQPEVGLEKLLSASNFSSETEHNFFFLYLAKQPRQY